MGTTNSCAAYMLSDRAEVIPNSDGMRTTPSVVYIKGDEMLVGTAAKRKAVLEPKNVVFEVKRFIGRKYSELTEDDKKVPILSKPVKMEEYLLLLMIRNLNLNKFLHSF